MTDATAAEPTLEQLQERARELDISGRSSMTKSELSSAIAEAEAAQAAGSTTPGGQPPSTDAQASTAGIVAAGTDPRPATPEEVGRPSLLDVARKRANRNPRVIGAETQED